MSEYCFDKDQNSHYHRGLKFRERSAGEPDLRRSTSDDVERLIANPSSNDPEAHLVALKKTASVGDLPEKNLVAPLQLYERTQDKEARAAIGAAEREIQKRHVYYRPEEVARIQKLSQLRVTKQSRQTVGVGGSVHLSLSVVANGTNFVVIEPARTR